MGNLFIILPLNLFLKKRKCSESTSRLGIVVSKKYSKSAVKRNHAKRILRENFRTSKLRNNGFDILAILSKPIIGSVNSEKK